MAKQGLTHRQREVLELVSLGFGNVAICAKLGITKATLRTHLENIMDALELEPRTRIALALKGRENRRAPLSAYHCEVCEKDVIVRDADPPAQRISVRIVGEELVSFGFVCPRCMDAMRSAIAKTIVMLGAPHEASE